jgi:general secretion pathway protein D
VPSTTLPQDPNAGPAPQPYQQAPQSTNPPPANGATNAMPGNAATNAMPGNAATNALPGNAATSNYAVPNNMPSAQPLESSPTGARP